MIRRSAHPIVLLQIVLYREAEPIFGPVGKSAPSVTGLAVVPGCVDHETTIG